MKHVKTLAIVLFLLATLVIGLTSCGGGNEAVRIEVDTNSFVNTYEQGQEIDLSGIKVNLVYNDGKKEAIPFADLTIGDVSTDELGTFTVNVEGAGFSTTITIYVVEQLPDVIEGFEKPVFVTIFENATAPQQNKEVEFKNEINYQVGDDNPFIFLPNITIWDEATMAPVPLLSYRSVSAVEIKVDGAWVALTDNLADYVAIDEYKSSYDFPELAIGETFRLTVAPYYMPEGEDFSVSFEFTVVDAWNVYTPADLSRIDNTNNAEWADYKAAHGIDNTDIAGVVLHNNITLTDADLPAAFFYTEDEASNPDAIGTMKDGEDLYYRTLAQGETFSFYGNGFTVDVSDVTPVHHTVYGVDFSNSSLFKIAGTNFDKTYSGTSACLVTDVSFIGNAGRTNDADEVERSLGGLIFCKYKKINAVGDNIILKSFFIGQFPEYNTDLTLDGCRVYDSLQDAMFVWSGAKVALNNCEFKRAGGPAIILQHEDPSDDDAANRFPTMTVNANCVIEAYVNGGEAWFVQTGFAGLAGSIAAMSGSIHQASSGLASLGMLPSAKSFTNDKGFMNCSYILMSNTAGTSSTAGVQGTVTVNGVVVCDKTPANTKLAETMATLAAISNMTGKAVDEIPIFQSSAGGVVWSDGTNLYVVHNGNPMTTLADYLAATGDASFFMGDYLTLYMNGMAITFAYANVAPLPVQ